MSVPSQGIVLYNETSINGRQFAGRTVYSCDRLQRRLAWRGNDNLKVGEVKKIDDKTIAATIVTKDGSLVRRITFDRKSGRPRTAR